MLHHGCHVTHFGSNANNGTNAGTFYWNVNNSSSNANRNIGTQLCRQRKLGEGSGPLGQICCHKSLVVFAKGLAGRIR